MDQDDLSKSVDGLSREAFELARAAAESGDFGGGKARARELNDALTALWPRIEASPEAERSGLSRAWSDARLDVGYVLSEGELDTSTQLYQVIQDRPPAPPDSA